MTEVLTSKMIKDLVRKLEQMQAESTSRCLPCGGEPWGPNETIRVCSLCRFVWIQMESVPDA